MGFVRECAQNPDRIVGRHLVGQRDRPVMPFDKEINGAFYQNIQVVATLALSYNQLARLEMLEFADHGDQLERVFGHV